MVELFKSKLLLWEPSARTINNASYIEKSADQLEMIMFAVMAASKGIKPMSKEAKQQADWSLWKRATKKEIYTLLKAGTWELVPQPSDWNVIRLKWVLQIKMKVRGIINKYKARLITK